MHELAFADCARPTPVAILKMPLTDYSIGHEALLLKQRNPLLILSLEDFLTLSYMEQCRAITHAVWICCNTDSENKGQWFAWLKVRIWRWRIRKENFPLAIADFRNYLESSRALPPAPDREAEKIVSGEKEAAGRELGAPLLANLIHFVATHYGYSAVWDFPYALASWLYFANLESDGKIKIENRKELDVKEELAQHEGDFEREREAENSGGLATEPPDLTEVKDA